MVRSINCRPGIPWLGHLLGRNAGHEPAVREVRPGEAAMSPPAPTVLTYKKWWWKRNGENVLTILFFGGVTLGLFGFLFFLPWSLIPAGALLFTVIIHVVHKQYQESKKAYYDEAQGRKP